MPIQIDKPFTPAKLEEERLKDKREVFTVSINEQERKWLDHSKTTLEQEKDSTALKQLAYIGQLVIHQEKTWAILETIFENKRRNKRLGINQYEV